MTDEMTADQALRFARVVTRDSSDPLCTNTDRCLTTLADAYEQALAERNRLREALSQANVLTEKFEREWYLRGDEIERLRADANRLDWLADPDNSIGNVQLPARCVTANLHSLRAAIDMAMRIGQTGD